MTSTQTNLNINLTHVPEQTDLAETLYDKRIITKYNYAFEYLSLDPNNLKNFLDDIKQFDVKIRLYNFNKILTYYIYGKNFFINLSINKRNFAISIYAEDEEILDKLYNIFKKYEDTSTDSKISLSHFSMTSQGLTTSIKTIKKDFFKNINENYYPFLDIDLFMDEFIFGNENILILCGAPGTGKSKFANVVMKKLLENDKYNDYFSSNEINNVRRLTDFDLDNLDLINSINNSKNYYIATAKDVNLVAADQFWDKMKNQDLVILDDLDFLLSSRKENREDVIKNQFLSHLLSFTDGIDDNKTKIIITTNQPFESIDEALLRKGRLFGILEFRSLTWKEALEVWESEGLPEQEFEKIFKKDIILHAELGEAIQNYKRNKKYISKKDYILDPSIDALRKAETRRAGLV